MTRSARSTNSSLLRPAAWVGLFVWFVVWFVAMRLYGGMSWHFFLRGESILFGPGEGLRLYAVQPQLQIGPVAFLVTMLVRPLSGSGGVLAAQLLCTALGGVVLLLVGLLGEQAWPRHRCGPSSGQVRTRLVVAGFAFVPVWMYLAVASLHLDDVLALTFAIAALLAAVHDRPVLVGLAVAAAVDSKPWALPFVAVVLLLPAVRDKVKATGVAAAGVLLGWLPFFLAYRDTVRALHFSIANRADSTLRVLGFADSHTPVWDRPAQTLIGTLLAVWVIRQRRWAAVLLVVMTARVVLDPGTNHYYTAGLAVGAVLWDVCGSRLRWPVWTAAVLVIHEAQMVHALDPLHGWLVLVFGLCVLGFIVAPPRVGPPHSVTRERQGPQGSGSVISTRTG